MRDFQIQALYHKKDLGLNLKTYKNIDFSLHNLNFPSLGCRKTVDIFNIMPCDEFRKLEERYIDTVAYKYNAKKLSGELICDDELLIREIAGSRDKDEDFYKNLLFNLQYKHDVGFKKMWRKM